QRRLRPRAPPRRDGAFRRRPHRDRLRPPGRLSHERHRMNQTEPLRPASRTAEPSPLILYGEPVASRLLLGPALYPPPQPMGEASRAAGARIGTVSLRREQARGNAGARFLDLVRALPVRLLPNTAGCRTAKEAVTTAEMARELLETDWIKL